MTLKFGRKILEFNSYKELYKLIGILTSEKYTKISWENNEVQGAWGSEGRIQIMSNEDIFPLPIIKRFTKGVGDIKYRVNCNDLINYLVDEHSFEEVSSKTSVKSIRPISYCEVKKTIPQDWLYFFEEGYSL